MLNKLAFLQVHPYKKEPWKRLLYGLVIFFFLLMRLQPVLAYAYFYI